LITQNATSISSTVQRLNDVDGNGTSMENSISAIVQNADEISSTVEGIKYKYALSVPEGAIAYWSDSLFDKINGLTPEGYTETWQPYEKTLSTIAQHSDEISQRIVAKDMDTGEVLRNTELLISDGKIQVIASMFEVLGDAIVNGTISANKLSSIIVEAEKYIQVGTENDGYRLDGSTGLNRLIGGYEKQLPAILKTGVAILDGVTEKVINIGFPTTYFSVMLNLNKFQYWNTSLQADSNRDLVLSWQKIDNSSFKILAYTQLSQTENDVNIVKQYSINRPTGSWNDSYLLATTDINTNTVLLTLENGTTLTHVYSSPGQYNILIIGGSSFSPNNGYISLSWGDGVVEKIDFSADVNGDRFLEITVDKFIYDSAKATANANVQYTVIGY
jgi:hypothetical protein